MYQGKCEPGIEDGLGSHLACNFLDVDPYGEPWPTIDAFFNSERPRPQRMAIAVNDGLRQKLRLQGGWTVHSMRGAMERFGNAKCNEKYLDVCRWKLEQIVARQRYRLTHWTGYYSGANSDMTHYAAILEKIVAGGKPATKVQRAKPRAR